MRKIYTEEVDDCLRCCVASILELNYEDVPHFVKEADKRWIEPFSAWCRDNDVWYVVLASEGQGTSDIIEGSLISGTLSILIGETVDGNHHAVVARWEDPELKDNLVDHNQDEIQSFYTVVHDPTGLELNGKVLGIIVLGRK